MERERERERNRKRERKMYVGACILNRSAHDGYNVTECVCVFLFVCKRERELKSRSRRYQMHEQNEKKVESRKYRGS